MADYKSIIETALADAVGHSVEISVDTHLIQDDVIDSLDSAIFLLNVEKAAGVKLSEQDVDEKDLFKVSNLVAFLES
ncbi:MAG: hypothetical protein AAGF74_03515 [Pseudomonadota bacterium]